MKTDDIKALVPFLTPEEARELDGIIHADTVDVLWRNLPGPQEMARNSRADITGYGGAAGGGKSDLLVGLSLMDHTRVLIVRREKAQAEGIIQRMTEVLGTSDGYNSQKAVWKLPEGGIVEFAGLDNEGDERRWQGRPHDLKAFDEVTEMREHQVRFMMGWVRSNNPSQRTRVVFTFNPPTTSDGRWVLDFFAPWIDKKHPNPARPGELRYFTTVDGKDEEVPDSAPFVMEGKERVYAFDEKKYRPEDILIPKSRTFIPARLTDNPYYMASGYMSTLQALPEPLRSQMLHGSFTAGIQEDPWAVIPTAWIEEAQARWKPRRPKGEMLAIGVDVARGGQDKTSIATRHMDDSGKGMWFDEPCEHPGSETPNGAKVAGLTIGERRDDAPIHIDVIGVGASPYDILNGMGLNVIGVNVSERARGTDKSGKLRFFNQRSELWWRMREALDPGNDTGIALPPSKKLLRELAAPKWEASGYTVKVESRDDIVKRIGHSPDMATAYILALMETPKIKHKQIASAQEDVLSYDPMHRG
jgi:hypothetical protein